MEIDKVRSALDKVPARSNYEFKHFEIEHQGNWHRQLRYALAQKELLTLRIQEHEAEKELLQHQLAKIKDKDEFAIRQKLCDAQVGQIRRKIQDLMQSLNQVDNWLGGYGDSEIRDLIDGFEDSEGENWSEQLGREIGCELLAEKQASRDTMMKLAMLPLSDYKKSVLISNQFAAFLKKTAEQVELTMAHGRTAMADERSTEPTGDQDVNRTIVTATSDPDDDMDDTPRVSEKKKKKKKKK